MYLTVLGCNGPYPAPDGACSGYLIQSDSGNTQIILDMGSGVLPGLNSLIKDPSKIDAVILSHLHFDHMSDMMAFGYMLDFSQVDAMKVICPETPKENRSLLKGKFDLYPMEDMNIGEFRVEFCRVRHPVESYAVRISGDGATFVYTGDTNTCPEIGIFADKADLLLADCGHSDADWNSNKPHLCPGKCADLAKECHVGTLVLTHISPKYHAEELLDDARRIFADTELAEKGMRFRI